MFEYPAPRSIWSSSETLAALSSTMRMLALRISATFIINLFLVVGWCVCGGEFESDVERVHKIFHFYRLGEIAEEARVNALLDVTRHGVRAESDDRNVRRSGVITQNLHRFQAADSRQVDVHEDYFGQ